jgi:outer membrane scaffolding protein for murein synthesis (MipA/OmpV family)
MAKSSSFIAARRAATLAAAMTLTLHTAGAWADEAPPSSSSSSSTSQQSDATAKPASKWKIGIGPGVVITPLYPGSRELRVFPYPALDISYDDRVFSQGPDVLGLNVLRSEDYHVGAALSFDFQSRQEKDDPHLHGLGNVDGGPKLKLFADYTVWMFTGSGHRRAWSGQDRCHRPLRVAACWRLAVFDGSRLYLGGCGVHANVLWCVEPAERSVGTTCVQHGRRHS